MKTPSPKAPPAPAAMFSKPNRGATGHRFVLYGPGGIGKTTLATVAPDPVVFYDLDDSLSRLEIGSEAQIVRGVETWSQIRQTLQSPGWDGIKTIVIDSATRAEELAVQHTLEHIPHEKGHKAASVEDYGYGKGFSHVFDTFLHLLADLDTHCRAGRNVILICHDCTATVPNPAGEDWIRYEPRLQSPASGKSSIRLRVREWADHVLFVGYDVHVDKSGKGRGHGSRTVYTSELPHCMAKSRTTTEPIAVGDADLWSKIIK